MAIDSLENASVGREQDREKVAIVAQEFDNRVRDSDIISTRLDAAREVVAMNVGLDYGARRRVGGTARIGGHPADAVCLSKKAETLVP